MIKLGYIKSIPQIKKIPQKRKSILISTLFRGRCLYLYSSKKLIPIVQKLQEKTIKWNLKSIYSYESKIDCLLIQNNENFNHQWLKKILLQTKNILLADGGANILYSEILMKDHRLKFDEVISKIKAIIGDLDSVTDEVKNFYQSKGVKLIKEIDQQKNDFQKTLIHGLDQGCKNFFVSGAFGNRLDHTLSTMSITEKYIKQNSDINIILSSYSAIYCPLRTGLRHLLNFSEDIQKAGCGLVTFQKVSNIETKGLKWNLGQKQKYSSIEWASFLSTSNQIVQQQVDIDLRQSSSGIAYFVATLKDG